MIFRFALNQTPLVAGLADLKTGILKRLEYKNILATVLWAKAGMKVEDRNDGWFDTSPVIALRSIPAVVFHENGKLIPFSG